MSERVSFGSRMGAIFAAAGSAVGLGNVWWVMCGVSLMRQVIMEVLLLSCSIWAVSLFLAFPL